MMKMNAGAWIGLVAGAVGLLVGVGVVMMTAGSTGIYISLGMLALFGGMFYLFYRIFFKPMMNASRLQKIGLPGKARILEVRDTGVTINNNPQVKLILEVKSSLGQTYQTQCRVMVSRLNPWAYQPGMELPVKIDPQNEQNVVIDFTSNSSNSAQGISNSFNAGNTDALKVSLEKLQEENNAILASGRDLPVGLPRAPLHRPAQGHPGQPAHEGEAVQAGARELRACRGRVHAAVRPRL